MLARIEGGEMQKISELMDGELDSQEASLHLKRLKDEPKLRENWELYHLVGDVLRREHGSSGAIAQGVMDRLDNEPTVLAPRAPAPRNVMRYAMSAAAALAGVAVVAWIAFTGAPGQRDAAQIAAVGVPAMQLSSQQPEPTVALPTSLAAQGEEVEDYLLAHQSVSAFRTMRGSLPYVRASASEESK
jgi:sigma-E factor negative regulatory protein RseA